MEIYNIFQLAGNVSKPLVLAAFFAVILFFIFKQILAKDIFPSLTKTGSFVVIKIIIDRLFWLSLVTALLSFAAYVADKPLFDPYSEPENSILSLEQKAIALHSDYKSIDDSVANDNSKNIVKKEASKLGRQILNIQDDKLGMAAKITKYDTALMVFVMAASVETNKSARTLFADKAIKSGNDALESIDVAFSYAKSAKPEYQEIESWINDNEKEDYINYLLAGAYAIKVKDGDVAWVDETKKRINAISKGKGGYLEREPLEKEEILKWFLDKYWPDYKGG